MTRSFFAVILIFFLGSCAPLAPAEPSPTVTSPIPTETATLQPTETLPSPTSTDVPPTATPTTSPTSTDSPPTQTLLPTSIATHEIRDLRLTIIYDNTAYDDRLTPEWGFSILVEYGEHTVLFDTGGSRTFMDNLHILDLDPKSVEVVVLSHDHGDHIGGLLPFLEEAGQPPVYVPKQFSWSFKRTVSDRTEVIEVDAPMEIFPGIYSTGQVYGGRVHEQGLAIDLGDEIVVITGCAHPGVVQMTRQGCSAVQRSTGVDDKPIALVIGGFHMMDASQGQVEAVIADLRELGVTQVSPTHCTGEETIAMFADLLGDDYVPGGAGQVIIIPGDDG